MNFLQEKSVPGRAVNHAVVAFIFSGSMFLAFVYPLLKFFERRQEMRVACKQNGPTVGITAPEH